MTIKKNTLIIIMSCLSLFSATTYILINYNKNNEQSKIVNKKEERANTIDKTINLSDISKDDSIDDKDIQKVNPKANTNNDLPVSSDENNIELIIPQDSPKTVEPSNDNIVELESSSAKQEKEIINYFKTLELETTINTEESSFDKVKDKINNAFFTTVDFIFYNKPIKGVTFNELTAKTKLEILNIASRIDNFIIKKFPNYKETIKDGGNKVYQFTAVQIGNLQNTIKETIGEDRYNKASDTIENGKEKVVEVKDNLFTNIKKWYENLRES